MLEILLKYFSYLNLIFNFFTQEDYMTDLCLIQDNIFHHLNKITRNEIFTRYIKRVVLNQVNYNYFYLPNLCKIDKT